MLPPGSPPSVPSFGLMERQSYVGPPAAWIAAMNFATVWSAATTPLSVAPLLSWISSRARMSGVPRLVTTASASRANLAAGLLAARFSTL